MTLRRLRWLLIPLVVAVALAALILPPRSLPERPALVAVFLGIGSGPWRRNAVEEHGWVVESARDRLRESIAIRSHGAADVLAARSAGALRSTVEPMVVLVRDRDVPEPKAREWLRIAEAALAPVPKAAQPGVQVVVALHTRDPRVGSTGTEWSYPSFYRYAFDGSAGRACIVDVVLPTKGAGERGRFDVPRGGSGGLLGRCVLYGRWGFPGREVGKWAGLGTRWGREWPWWYGQGLLFTPRRTPRDTISWRRSFGGEVPWAELACFRGGDAYCLSLSGLASAAALGRPANLSFYGWGIGNTADRLVADLIRERGPERFAAFWTSSLRPDSALELAYGTPAGVLAREALARRYVPEPLAQRGAGKLLVAGGWVLALGLLAMALSWRREMDL